MKSFDFEAVVYDGAVYCVECLPKAPDGYEHQQVTVDSDEVSPIFADSEWDHAPVCDACGAVHTYMTVFDLQIRPYGPGKFSTILDSYVYSVSLDGGCDEESGSSDEGGWYGLMRNGSTIFRDHDPLLEPLNTAEREQLTAAAGVIVSEDSQGFVSVEYFDTDDELDRAWAEIEAEHNPDDDSEPSEPEDEDVTANDPSGPFYYLGKQVAADRAELRAWMERESYFPNVWFISDHGNAHLLTDIHDPSAD